MSSRPIPIKIRHTMAFRLTIWYAALFIVSSFMAFLFFYWLLVGVLYDQSDKDLLSDVQTMRSILRLQGLDAVKRQAVLESQAAGERKIFFRFLYPDGTVFSSTNISHWRDIGIRGAAITRLLQNGEPVFDTIQIADRQSSVRVLYALVAPGLIVQLGRSMDHHTRVFEAFRKIFILIMTSVFFFAVIFGWFLARRATQGVEMVTRTARRIADGSFAERVPVKNRADEIDQLAITFNQMLDRLQVLMSGIREMSDNIAHDLKSPLTRIRGLAEVTLTAEPGITAFQNMAASTIEECDRLLNIINTMLFISKTEAGAGQLNAAPLDLAALVKDACALYRSVADDKHVSLIYDGIPVASYYGDIRLLQRMVANLLDNAIKYTPEGGRVHVDVQTGASGSWCITVADTGSGIADKDLPYIFERFYRADPSRSATGTGLGLSFARVAARAHGGDITASSSPDKGAVFRVELPILTI